MNSAHHNHIEEGSTVMRHLLKASIRTTAIGIFGLIGISGVVMAGETCDPKKPECACDPTKQECPPPPKTRICHNIGGPRDLGVLRCL